MSMLVRPRGLEHLDSVVDLIERDVKSTLPQPGTQQQEANCTPRQY
jgi:hypothetical protein